MENETRQCKNCSQDFEIASEDFSFYEKVKVPPPTWCPECRLIRRLVWRNERNLYKDKCKLCDKSIISVYDPNGPYVVYCPECWKGDGWDPMDYAQDYDFTRPFFEQLDDLMKKVPRSSLNQNNAINSPYANYIEDVKNIYLSYSVIHDCENVYYSRLIDHSKDIFDSCDLSYSEQCYENVSGEKNYNTQFTYFCRNTIDSIFVYDCWNSSHCFLSTNLRNQKYCYKNKVYSENEYQKIIESYDLGTPEGLARAKSEFEEMYQKAVHRFAHTSNAVNSTGENLRDCRNVKHSFFVTDSENSKYIFRSPKVKDSMDSSHLGSSEQIYEYMNAGATGSQLLKFCVNFKPANSNSEYSDYCGSVSNVFGSVGVRNKSYVIFNKQYSKESFDELRTKIIEHMDDIPYVDKKGRVYKYGEFFPLELSPFSYNETLAHEYFPKIKSEINELGFKFKEREERKQEATVAREQIMKDIKEVGEDVVGGTIACDNEGNEDTLCTSVFKILPEELAFHKKNNIALVARCPNCRYFERTRFVNPLKLWHRSCMNEGCTNKFETSYSPERPEKVYCESCYNKEVY